jgi:4-hydroxy-tetrahydrodipicolinate synthase
MTTPFTGLIAYPITPTTIDGELNLASMAQLVTEAATAGVGGITVLASSGAGVTFDRSERRRVLETAIKAAAGSGVPVYTAITAVSTREVTALAADAERAGAAGVLVAPFGYYPLSDPEVRTLFKAVGDSTSLPICFYNKPAQLQYDVTPDTLLELARGMNLRGVKESTARADVAGRVGQIRSVVGPDVAIGLSGDLALLRDLPVADAWHTGLAALMPSEYASVWRERDATKPEHEMVSAVAAELSQIPRWVGALHALSALRGVATAAPRGPFAAALPEDTLRLQRLPGSLR